MLAIIKYNLLLASERSGWLPLRVTSLSFVCRWVNLCEVRLEFLLTSETLERNVPISSAPNQRPPSTLSWLFRTLRNRYRLFSFCLVQQASIQWTEIQKLGTEKLGGRL